MYIYGIDANLLVSLDALLREASVTRAAHRVGITQSAMSHALGRLRDHLGDPLLVRAGRNMVLTAKAESLAPRVSVLVEEMSRVFAPDEEFEPAALRRGFALRATDHAQFVLMPEVDRLLRAEAPGVDLVVTALSGGAVAPLRQAQSDLTLGTFSDHPSDIHSQALLTDRFVCLVRGDHPAIARGLGVAQYAAMTHIHVGPAQLGVVDRVLGELGIARRISRVVPHVLVARC